MVSQKRCFDGFSLLTRVKTCMWPNVWCALKNVQHGLEEDVCSVVGGSIVCMSVTPAQLTVFTPCGLSLTFCLVLPIVSKVDTAVPEYHRNSVGFWSIHFEALSVGACMFVAAVSSWWVVCSWCVTMLLSQGVSLQALLRNHRRTACASLRYTWRFDFDTCICCKIITTK